jgi:hypothetical protein
MRSAPFGMTIHDGCTINTQHHIGVFVSFSSEVTVWEGTKSVKKFKPEVRMIGCAPPPPLDKPLVTGQRQARNQDDAAEAKEFNAHVQLNYLHNRFDKYGIDYNETWTVVSDSG